MSEPIKMAGKIMEIGKVDACKRMFAEECKITYPDKIPVTLGFNFNDSQKVIGNCEVIRTKDGLTAKATVYNSDILYAPCFPLFSAASLTHLSDEPPTYTVRSAPAIAEISAAVG